MTVSGRAGDRRLDQERIWFAALPARVADRLAATYRAGADLCWSVVGQRTSSR